MNKLQSSLIAIIIGLIVFTSCGPSEYPKIPLNQLEPKLKNRGSMIVKDILKSFKNENGARYLLHKDYMTALVHGRIVQNANMYKEAYEYVPITIGKIASYSLFQVLDKGLIKTMRYQLKTDSETMEFIELKIDVNIEMGLADYYLYVTSKDGFVKRENILPRAIK
ncbi:hypothetical protein [Carboxylicivirga marina]|uniref:DUF4251 domain-containing protein n=1 Tax=Carboxylicivirga marina TaxID=2800988 RepID=A0ABS1HHN4_9BACT|nr:hypothetical protein [Carboxylicivirga marina]MBK3517176.1 hypothetical protein [Carboxylicivirga marina]